MGLKLYALLGVIIAFLLLGSAFLIEREKVKTREAQNAATQVKLDVSEAVVEQGKQNQAAQKKQTAGKKQDAASLAPVEAEIKDLDQARYLNEKESMAAIDLMRHFRCDGVMPSGDPDCNPKLSVLPNPAEAKPPLVTIQSLIDSCAAVVEYAHDLERTTQCYEDSMKQDKK